MKKNNLAIAKELIKNGASKELILKSIDITEEDYNMLVKEVQKEFFQGMRISSTKNLKNSQQKLMVKTEVSCN